VLGLSYIKPRRLRRGDTIAILAPSGGAARLFPHRLERGASALESLGFKCRIYPTCSNFLEGKAGTPEERAADINSAFADNGVHAIMAVIGGVCSNEIVELLDYETIRTNPKIFCGYSDTTVVHNALAKRANLVTFYGPCLMTQFGEYPEPLAFTVKSFLKTTMCSDGYGRVESSPVWSDEILDWSKKLDLSRPRVLKPNYGAIWLREGKASGLISGGCLHTVHQLQGTPIKCEMRNRILLLEVPAGQSLNDAYPLSYVEAQLVDLRLAGVFNEISGLLIGRPPFYSAESAELLFEAVKKVTSSYSFPILAGLDFGHTDPMVTIPLNVLCSIDSDTDVWSIDESGVASL
jgi:muramoyltetrapeptide carboxypeptidase LdcA involved in peptidoglycan recycling